MENNMSSALPSILNTLTDPSENLTSKLNALSKLEEISNTQKPIDAKIVPFFCRKSRSGFELTCSDNENVRVCVAAPTTGGFTIEFQRTSNESQQWYLFSSMGCPRGTTQAEPSLLDLECFQMAPLSPIKSYLLDLTYYEYARAAMGDCDVERASFIEYYLQGKNLREDLFKNLDFRSLLEKVSTIERMPTLNWKERRLIFRQLKIARSKTVYTKARLWKWPWWQTLVLRLLESVFTVAVRFFLRPWNNFGGIVRICTLDAVIWFFQTVRNNIGYSIALAIYGPFTFYFITQPLNPKAMWAVAEVRNAYLKVVKDFGNTFVQPLEIGPLGTGMAAIVEPKHLSSEQSFSSKNFSLQSWQQRMSAFKGLQIAFEENMVFAARMGRIEQIESQLLFPLTARAAWTENSFYLDALQNILQWPERSISEQEISFIQNEIKRCQRARDYIWSKLQRFLGDHYFIVLDGTHDHTFHNRYLGEAISLFVTISNELSPMLKNELDRSDLEVAKKLGSVFVQSGRHLADPILTRIAKEVPSLSNPQQLADFAYRTPMLRQWETLFLLQNRTQEAANYGRMAYTESVRTSLFALQTITAAKRNELERNFSKKNGVGHKNLPETLPDALLEHSYHLMFADLASIAPELRHRLLDDTEYRQRVELLTDLRHYFQERAQLWKSLSQKPHSERN